VAGGKLFVCHSITIKAASPQSGVSFQLAICYETLAGSLRHVKSVRCGGADLEDFHKRLINKKKRGVTRIGELLIPSINVITD
jgi:hypothetical protein